jgi:hypothetical protein
VVPTSKEKEETGRRRPQEAATALLPLTHGGGAGRRGHGGGGGSCPRPWWVSCVGAAECIVIRDEEGETDERARGGMQIRAQADARTTEGRMSGSASPSSML